MDSGVIEAFGRIDPNGLRTYLLGLVQKRPTAQNWGLYGDNLAQARRPREAIAAWLEAIKLDPAAGAARSLITHAPLEAIRQLRRGATERMDDEMLGDMGDALWQLGRKDDAVGLWQQAHGIDKGDSEWTMKLARVHSGADPLSR